MHSASELTVIVPTLNERDNIVPLLEALRASELARIDFEVVFVDDDSQDGTSDFVRSLALGDCRVRVLKRIGRKGLSSAAVEGMLSSSAPYLAVMDGDLQHDERILPLMLAKLKQEHLDIVIGSRHIAEGSMGEMASHRQAMSRVARYVSRIVCHAELSDPMSGFFVLTRQYLDEVGHDLSSTGFKILLDMVASAHRPVKIGEVPYQFRPRLHGESKLDVIVLLEYFQLIVDKLVGNWIPVSYVMYALAGSVGAAAYLTLMTVLRMTVLRSIGVSSLGDAQLISSLIVIGLNFLLNNQFTFRALRLRGRRFAAGLLIFYVACSVGVLFNLRTFEYLRSSGAPWYVAAVAGMFAGSLWNYWISSVMIWQVRRRRRRATA